MSLSGIGRMWSGVLTTFSISDILFQKKKKDHLEVYFFQKKTTVSLGQGVPHFFSVKVMIVNILFFTDNEVFVTTTHLCHFSKSNHI